MIKKILKYLCPHFWFKKKKREIVFYGNYRYVDKVNPILNACDVERAWVKRAKKVFDDDLIKKNQKVVRSGHRCLGINDLMNTGFILKNDIEFAVETNGNDGEIKIHIDGGEVTPFGSTICNSRINFFDKKLLSDYTSPMGANPYLLKKSTSWYVTAPKDIVFLMLPVTYADDNRFMANAGILDPVMTTQINVVLWWFVKNGYEVVRKDVPLAQLIPIPRNKIYDSWKMVDRVPDIIYEYINVQENMQNATKCPMYSQYKKISQEIYDF